MQKTHLGYLLIADITGYTHYLSESELEHAQDTLTALLELLVANTHFPLIISRLAGDAVISYGFQEDFLQGQTFLELIEELYVTYRKTIKRLVLNNTCQCKACKNISSLDLKFFIHYGSFGIQHILGHDELVGNDVNLLHRLLKNTVWDKYHLKAYGLYTEAVIKQLELQAMTASMIRHTENLDDLGEVQVYIQDLHPVWEDKRSSIEIKFPDGKVLDRSEVFINVPKERVWDYITQPAYRNILIGSNRMEIKDQVQGRIAPGSIYQCYHGDKWVPHLILEWQVFERMITRESNPLHPKLTVLVEYHLKSTSQGTLLSKTISKLRGPFLGRLLIHLMAPLFRHKGKNSLASFKNLIEQETNASKQVNRDHSTNASEMFDQVRETGA
jgi:hypothetical protein